MANAPATTTALKAIIMTVGLPGDQGGDVLDALQLDLEALQPEFLALISSEQSEANARRMADRSGLPAEQTLVVALQSAHDLDEVFRTTNDVVQQVVRHGYTPAQIAINYTSGTKVMGSGAVLSALYNKISQLRYITGLASIGKGRHRILTTRPDGIFAYQDLLTSRAMLISLRFRSAHAELDQIVEDFLTENDRLLRDSLRLVTSAYGGWDDFHPSLFLENYPKIDFTNGDLKPFQLAAGQWETVEALAAELRENKPGPHIITDLFCNAARRMSYGHLEDAMTRLYRALEMLAQYVLNKEYGLDTNDLDTRRIPPRDRVAYEAMRSLEDGVVKIGLRKAYELLGILKHPIGVHFQQDAVLRRFLTKRAETILAHGLLAETDVDGREFMAHTRQLCAIEILRFADLCRALQFPWLKIEG
jgi:CRISPR-associated protein (TIGR02710 family)